MANDSNGTSFLDLPREIREMIYEWGSEEPEFGNMLDLQGAGYTKATAPLLYIHQSITNDLQSRIYKNQTIVLPFQEPSQCLKSRGIAGCGSWQSLADIKESRREYHRVTEKGEDQIEDPEDYAFWDDDSRGDLTDKLEREFLAIKRAMPALKQVKFILWCGLWTPYEGDWTPALENLSLSIGKG
ncbi:hypothetical protein B0O99DRAFT_589237 [Bisporella sp. PMI_857]|nr:hypothetical protein B0O99DRAFT_589237 [Bisporella sp. PMI_857]